MPWRPAQFGRFGDGGHGITDQGGAVLARRPQARAGTAALSQVHAGEDEPWPPPVWAAGGGGHRGAQPTVTVAVSAFTKFPRCSGHATVPSDSPLGDDRQHVPPADSESILSWRTVTPNADITSPQQIRCPLRAVGRRRNRSWRRLLVLSLGPGVGAGLPVPRWRGLRDRRRGTKMCPYGSRSIA